MTRKLHAYYYWVMLFPSEGVLVQAKQWLHTCNLSTGKVEAAKIILGQSELLRELKKGKSTVHSISWYPGWGQYGSIGVNYSLMLTSYHVRVERKVGGTL